ncbi:MAG: tetratricopeptide repeat protein [Kiritimatiellae bacterium]|nr:tetratricopeptide repeat protein [Kiritimatiellia bacterium]
MKAMLTQAGEGRLRRVGVCLLMIAGPVLLMLVLGITPGISMGEDLGRHLLLGRIILERGAVPRTNLLTFTWPDFPFINHHWLSEVLLCLLHKAGGLNGLIVFKAAVLTLALALALVTVRPRSLSCGYWLAGLLAAVLLGFRSHIRPELFTFVGVALMGWGLERLRAGRGGVRWLLLGYMWLWSNAHIYFIFGLGMAAAFVLERGWLRWRESRRGWGVLPWADAGWLGLLVAVSASNPNGVAGLLYPFGIFANYGIDITENASPLEYWRTVLNPMLLALPILSAMTAVALIRCFLVRRSEGDAPPRLANYVIAAAALAAAWSMARSVPLLALTALPVVGEAFRARRKTRTVALAGIVVCGGLMLALNASLVFAVLNGSYTRIWPSPIGPTAFGFDHEERFLALRRLKAEGLPGRVFSDYNVGSLVEYNLYPEPGYVDNRPEAFPAAFWQEEYLPAVGLGDVFAEVCARRGIQAVAVSLPGVKEGFVRELMNRPEWVLVHLDHFIGVWCLDVPANRGFVERHRFDAARLEEYARAIEDRVAGLPEAPFWRRQVLADRAVYEVYSLLCIGAVERLWPALWRLHEMYPDYQIVHELLRVSAPPDAVPAVKEIMARRARWPVAAKQVLDWGRVLEAEGRRDEALGVYERGLRFFPLSPDLRTSVERLRFFEGR